MNVPGKIKLMLVDDHFFVRKGLAASLNDEADIEVVAEARNGDEAVGLFDAVQPDITLMDLTMSGGDGISALNTIRSKFPGARVMIFSVNEGEEDIFRAISAGARGYLPKSVDRMELLRAIRLVHAGEMYLTQEAAQLFAIRCTRPNLSPRERSVLERIVAGRTNKEIGGDLGISELTVRQYVSSLLEKLSVLDRTQAATAAVQRGIVRLG